MILGGNAARWIDLHEYVQASVMPPNEEEKAVMMLTSCAIALNPLHSPWKKIFRLRFNLSLFFTYPLDIAKL
jgi:hypothetical protein